MGKSGSVTNGDQFDFTFSAADKVTAVGATVMSRSSDGGLITGTVTFSDASTATATFTQAASDGGSDIFLGFRSTEAQVSGTSTSPDSCSILQAPEGLMTLAS